MREKNFEQMEKESLDLLIIGGGITGAGIALDATSRGLKVGLIEMNDFAFGTSSRSTKLIHGGLRYLKQLDIKLVSEVGKERAIVYKNAPHLTSPEWMLLPIVKGGTYGKWMTSLGLKIYDWLARVKKEERRKMLSKEKTIQNEPLLREDILLGSGLYVEYVTNDARLTIEVLKEAVCRGAHAVNYVKAENLLYQDGRVVGVEATDQISNIKRTLYAKKVVNACGPWVDTIREKDRSKTGKHLMITKGIHIVVSREKFPLKQAVYFDNEDGRMLFAIPKNGKTYIGTTDTEYDGDLARPIATEEDCIYLLNGIASMFPSICLSLKDIESSWAGLRPLIHEHGKAPSEISRKDEIFESPSGLISIAGGKLTGYRKMAERVVDLVCMQLNKYTPCKTENIKLSGGNMSTVENLIEEIRETGHSIGLSDSEIHLLTRRYGSNIEKVFAKVNEVREYVKGESSVSLSLLLSLFYSLEEEMTVTPTDFFIRRTSDLYFNRKEVEEQMMEVATIMAYYGKWSDERLSYELTELNQQLEIVKFMEGSTNLV
ncbi:glycerol-3-phosphate dehydrogenase [Lottiidibacillus patelloidae]|uniref:Glycerol-3-phosphate dehydrogenase n=1 Tax=Lottiidibacillus patelloidae TaxID=2670334 RepID=A0A263BZN6_9BACI|nr:glycerol-3-phosphate dehydrogenase/oxidase [Lottiidibacillus patelloidae]OZM58727.1 glycerol-3-phosphate dehydrogenase [Lottiidibacillus patelloidae]